MSPAPRQRLGAAGERLAVRALEEAGLRVITRNWRGPSGELDIVAQEDGPDYVRGGAVAPWLVFVEVRTRRGREYGTALQSITPRKQAKVRTVAAEYVAATGWQGPWRIDVVAVQMSARGELEAVEHIRHAVGG